MVGAGLHYVGQEKCRPIEGWGTLLLLVTGLCRRVCKMPLHFFILRQINGNMKTHSMNKLKAPTVAKSRYKHPADYNALAARLGWMPSYPQFTKTR